MCDSRLALGARPSGLKALKTLNLPSLASPKSVSDASEPHPEPLGRAGSRREFDREDGTAISLARARHETAVDHLRTLAERIESLEAENSRLRGSEERLRSHNQELIRQVHQLRVERQRPVERLRGVIDESLRGREVRRAPELRQERQEVQEQPRRVQVRLGGVQRCSAGSSQDSRSNASSSLDSRSNAGSSQDSRSCKPQRDSPKGLQPRQLRITHRLGTVRRGGA